MPDYTLSAKITGDSSGYKKAIDDAEKSTKSFEKRLEDIANKAKSIGDKISGIGTKLTVGVTTPITLAGKSMVTAASDFNENLNKIGVAFGNSAEVVKEWADTATESFGLSKNQALEATALFGDMATSMGLSQGEAASMSTSLTGLAGDLASFKNIGIDQAMTALNGVFTGETESLKQLGIVMTETNLQEFANGLGLAYDEMSQAEKVQLRYNYVMEMSKNAIGDYARTSDGTANSMRTFQASVDNLSASVGQNLLPVITPAIQKATDLVNEFSAMDPQMQKTALKIAGIAAAAGPALIVLGKLTSGIGSITTGFKMFLSPSNKIIAILAALAAGFAFLMTTNDDFRSSISESLAIIGDAAATILPQLLDLLESIGGFLADTIAGVLEGAAPFIAGIFNTVAQFVEFVANNFDVIGPLIAGIGAAFLTWNVISMVTSLIQTLSQLPTLLTTLGGGVKALNAAISANPIAAVISLIAGLVTAIMLLWNKSEGFRNAVLAIWDSLKSAFTAAKNFIVNLFDQVVSVVSGAIDRIRSIISTVAGFFQGAFESAASIVRNIINGIGDFFAGFVQTVKSSWSGLTNFVSGIFSGISSAFDSLVSGVKSVINTVIRGINGAIGIINLIPGVNIGKISYLLHGTDDWQGGFAYMNEGGRGELTYLPNGAQVIPHDISVQYAKAAARENRGSESIDLSGVLDGVVIQVINNTSVDGTPLKESISDYTIRRIGNQQRAYNRSRGLSYA